MDRLIQPLNRDVSAMAGRFIEPCSRAFIAPLEGTAS